MDQGQVEISPDRELCKVWKEGGPEASCCTERGGRRRREGTVGPTPRERLGSAETKQEVTQVHRPGICRHHPPFLRSFPRSLRDLGPLHVVPGPCMLCPGEHKKETE